MGLLDSKTIIITGGSVGIGFTIAKKCAGEGAEIIIVARNKNRLEKSMSQLKKISNKKHRFYPLDVSDPSAVYNFADWVRNKDLEISGLVNCAGVYGPIGKTTEVDMGDFTDTIKINLLGTFYMCKTIGPCLESAYRKKIVNFSGGGAASPFPNYTAYATSKAAIVRFTENISIELAGDNFDVNCIAPGFVVTRLHQDTIEAGPNKAGKTFYESTKKQIESGGIPPEKAADLTLFLLSQESDGITGKFISAPWDPWQNNTFQNRLRKEKDFSTLRRIDDKFYFKK